MRYYYREHIAGYERMLREGKRSWHDTQRGGAYDDFPSRPFLETVLPGLRFDDPHPTALEIGCGTGVATCFLAARGFRVDAFDLIPTAIGVARQVAAERGLEISYWVQDVCDLPRAGEQYDLIVDSFCLQGIVFDEDRAKVFGNVRARLKPEGYYLVSTAMFDPDRFDPERTATDEETGIVYHRYGPTGLIDPQTGIVYVELAGEPGDYEAARRIGGDWRLPNRRHLKPPELKADLENAGFQVLWHEGGNAVCAL